MFWLAVVSIMIGLIVAIFEEQVLFPSLVWFVLAIAFNTLGNPRDAPWRRKPE